MAEKNRSPVVFHRNYRFGAGQLYGTAVAAELEDGTARGHATADEGGWHVTFEMPWTEPSEVALAAVRHLWHCKHKTGMTGADPLPLINSIELRDQNEGLQAGQYYPRIWRPRSGLFDHLDLEARTDGQVAARMLEEAAQSIFEFISPLGEGNRKCYGHRIRQLLILACTEVENAWREVLVANGVQKSRFTTNDYVKLHDALRLRRWKLFLKDYPGYPVLEPFKIWSPDSPTQSLVWYAAYNSTKHARQVSFAEATLETAILALAAVWAMHGAIFGPTAVLEGSRMFTTSAQVHGLYQSHWGYLQPIIENPYQSLQPVNFPFA